MENPIGIFDSGMGGLTVLAEAVKLLNNENFIYYGDSLNAPYGVKTKEQVIKHSIDICDYLIEKESVKVIIVACNTATSAAINVLRKKYDIPIIGMEPAIKPALENLKDKNIGVMATEMTLKENKFNNLVARFNAQDKIIKIPCSELVEIIEHGKIEENFLNKKISNCFENIDIVNIESIVLGCTHFLFAKNVITDVLGKDVTIYDGNLGTVRHLIDVLKSNNLLNKTDNGGKVKIINSADDKILNLSKKLYQKYLRDING